MEASITSVELGKFCGGEVFGLGIKGGIEFSQIEVVRMGLRVENPLEGTTKTKGGKTISPVQEIVNNLDIQ